MSHFGPKTHVHQKNWSKSIAFRASRGYPLLSIVLFRLDSTVRDREAVVMWMRLLTKELADRIVVDRKVWSRRATKLTLQIISLRAIR